MTTYKTDETKIYNLAVKRTNKVKKKLSVLYQEAFERIEGKLATIRINKTEGLPISEFQEQRLERLLFQIDQELRRLRISTESAIRTGMFQNLENTYLDTGYILEREVNLGAAFSDLAFDVKFNYPVFPREVIQAALTDLRVGGHTFKDRMLREQRLLQYQVRQETAQAIIEGIPVREFEKHIATIKDAMGRGTARVQATARTEMLRAYSIGQQEAIDIAEDGGLEGDSVWGSTLDGKTRKDHVIMDLKKTDPDGLFTLPDGSRGLYPRAETLSAKESVNCRCRKKYQPFGISPTIRTAKLPGGGWETVPANMNARTWRKTLKGQEVVEEAKQERLKRARRLAKKRAEK
jgi:hypothetical protein